MATTKELIEQINRLFTENRMDAFMDYLAEFSTIVIEGDRASVQGSSTNKKADGTQYESNFCDSYQFKDDKIVRMSSYVVDNIK